MTEISQSIIREIRSIPEGKIATYGQIARRAGNPRGARVVARILHSSSDRYGLPWYRVVGNKGRILLASGMGLEEQAARLQGEGIKLIVSSCGRHVSVDLTSYGYFRDVV